MLLLDNSDGAGVMAQQINLTFTTWQPSWVPVQVLVAPLLLQLSTIAPGKLVEVCKLDHEWRGEEEGAERKGEERRLPLITQLSPKAAPSKHDLIKT